MLQNEITTKVPGQDRLLHNQPRGKVLYRVYHVHERHHTPHIARVRCVAFCTVSLQLMVNGEGKYNIRSDSFALFHEMQTDSGWMQAVGHSEMFVNLAVLCLRTEENPLVQRSISQESDQHVSK